MMAAYRLNRASIIKADYRITTNHNGSRAMKLKWYYVTLPACISFGPFFMAGMGGLQSNSWLATMVTLMGVVMVTFGLGIMYSMIFEQRRVIDQLTKQQNESPTNT